MIMKLDPPAERDLPAGGAARMRVRLRFEMHGPATARRRRTGRLALAGVATLAAAAAVATPFIRDGDPPTTIAMGPGELTSSLTATAKACLHGYPDGPMFEGGPRFPVTVGDLSVAVQHRGRTGALFLTDQGYVACSREAEPGHEESGGFHIEFWNGTRDWLPGPVQVLSRSSSEAESGWVIAAGRISARVGRLTLEHGNGTTTAARLSDGTFGLLTRTDDVQPAAELVAYDRGGREVWRERFFKPLLGWDQCYTAPDGGVVYENRRHKEKDAEHIGEPVGTPEPAPEGPCRPAEAWQP
ncbi:hypothetical protein Aca07nite_75770 [Actinoplanes capillaceus]|uniref:Uncharacterized protein n=1 Tax=Actinoplanes campanulatus TaxID=113559 RepID=A0ABQ3WVI5_9ACTN|nr:hypothetical protein [Actinoplanes capillaceus]GID50302.1 hypothetical protein Aca07nite_75770 [Actinoplanes capillaceus]